LEIFLRFPMTEEIGLGRKLSDSESSNSIPV
jgi:hypothetical protein